MTFDIRFLPNDADGRDGVDAASLLGRITLGDEIEDFISSIGFWSSRDYNQQWTSGLQRLVADGCDSCLITSIEDPAEGGVMRWWLLYPRGQAVHLQEALLFLDQQPHFSVDDPYGSIPGRRVETGEGTTISEWVLARSDFARCLAGRSGG